MNNKQIFAQNLQRYMNKNGITRRKLSSDLNIKYTTLTDWIRGHTYPRINSIQLLADYFHISKTDLIETQKPVKTKQTPQETPQKPFKKICETQQIYKIDVNLLFKVKQIALNNCLLSQHDTILLKSII